MDEVISWKIIASGLLIICGYLLKRFISSQDAKFTKLFNLIERIDKTLTKLDLLYNNITGNCSNRHSEIDRILTELKQENSKIETRLTDLEKKDK